MLFAHSRRRHWILGSVFLTAIVALLAFSVFGPVSRSASSSSLEGSWHTSATTDTTETPLMTADIGDNTISITWKSEDTNFLYWKGTFPASKTQADGSTIVSAGDVEEMDNSIMGSQDRSKTFTYKDGKLVFRLAILGVSRNIILER